MTGDLACFNAVIAENGAVVDFPASGRHVWPVIPARAFVDSCGAASPFLWSKPILVAGRVGGNRVLGVRETEQPLILAFNRGRLMVLPQAIAKSTVCGRRCSRSRVSIHNTVGIGDAENDHDLLDACEVGVAVAWGSPALRAVADEGESTAPARGSRSRLRPDSSSQQPRLSRRRSNQAPAPAPLGRSLLGEPVSSRGARAGPVILKSPASPAPAICWLAGLLCEQLILQGYGMCIMILRATTEPLETLPGVIILGGDDPPPGARELVEALRYPDVSVVVCDLSKMPHTPESFIYWTMLLPLLMTLRRRTGLPQQDSVDEAHSISGRRKAHCSSTPSSRDTSWRPLACPASPNIPQASAVVMVTRETNPHEAACRSRRPARSLQRHRGQRSGAAAGR